MAKKQFKAESKRLLDLMINSIYTHKEIFLRELISNASDAVDKLAYKALTDDQVGLNRSDFKITLTPDQIARTLTISDNGIGMTKEELEQNLGTIARSGSLQFKQELAKQENGGEHTIDIIGQFGVGFYSAFMVADHVTVTSRAYGCDEAWQWESDGADGYTIDPLREGERRHRHRAPHQAKHRGRALRRVPGAVPPGRAGQKVLRLHPLPHRHAHAQVPPEAPPRGCRRRL